MLKPYQQGGLDGLCAIYCIVNAARIISSIRDTEAKELFRRILEYLEQSRDLSRVLSEGIGLVTIGGIFRHVVGDLIPYRSMPYKNLPDTPLDEFWSEMTRFLEIDSERAILIGLGGPMWDHWSIVHEITARQIRFFDSHKLRRLNRSRCTTTRSNSRRPHILCPTHTYFLSLKPHR
jgi:hypothetical protein